MASQPSVWCPFMLSPFDESTGPEQLTHSMQAGGALFKSASEESPVLPATGQGCRPFGGATLWLISGRDSRCRSVATSTATVK
jgi:hypothetical protein